MFDVNAKLSGDVADKFIDYKYQINRNIIGEAVRKTDFLSHIPDSDLDMRSRYPEITCCME